MLALSGEKKMLKKNYKVTYKYGYIMLIPREQVDKSYSVQECDANKAK